MRPILIFLLSYLAGYLVIQGEIRQVCHDDVVNAFVYIAGYGVIVFTSLGSIIHSFRHPNSPILPREKLSGFVFTQKGTPPAISEESPGVESQ